MQVGIEIINWEWEPQKIKETWDVNNTQRRVEGRRNMKTDLEKCQQYSAIKII